jgi:hypothetical protein
MEVCMANVGMAAGAQAEEESGADVGAMGVTELGRLLEQEAEGEAEGDGEAQETAETELEGEPEAGAEKSEKHEPLSPEIQAIIDKRIGKEVAKRKDLEDQLEAERGVRAKLEADAKDLTEQLSVKGQAPVTGNAFDSLEDVEKREDQLWGLLEFVRSNPDGFDGDDKNGIPAYTVAQIREMQTRFERELHRDLPRQKQALVQRAEVDREVTAKVYPELLQNGSKEQRIAERFLRQFPVLRNLPNVNLLLGDMIAGERLRMAKVEDKGEAGLARTGKGEAGLARTKTAVAAPGGRPVAAVGVEKKKGLNMRALAESGFSREGLAAALDG